MLHRASGDRQADPADNAYPSGPSAAAAALLSWSALTGDTAARDVADAALDGVRRVAGGAPRFAGWGLAAAEAALDGPREVAVVGPLDDPRTAALHRQALAGAAPGLVVAVGADPEAPAVPLLRDRGLLAGAPAAYPCRAMVCDLPTSDTDVLRAFVGP